MTTYSTKTPETHYLIDDKGAIVYDATGVATILNWVVQELGYDPLDLSPENLTNELNIRMISLRPDVIVMGATIINEGVF